MTEQRSKCASKQTKKSWKCNKNWTVETETVASTIQFFLMRMVSVLLCVATGGGRRLWFYENKIKEGNWAARGCCKVTMPQLMHFSNLFGICVNAFFLFSSYLCISLHAISTGCHQDFIAGSQIEEKNTENEKRTIRVVPSSEF